MRKLQRLLVPAAALLLSGAASATNWQLVWSDEFNGSIGPDWSFQTGGGGWGNNEQEYYRQENATIENNALVITAKKEDFGGYHYTSARMSTQGHKSWTYGRMEARIALPARQGLWPAFWMLGNNIGSVGWPGCGEIDIMEQINTSGTVYGSAHWTADNGSQADYSQNMSTSVQDYHVYAVEWDTDYIRWFVDGTQYNVMQITNNVGGTDEFHRDFFVLLNMAVGGNWPGFSIDDSALPAKMYVDYVRVYAPAGTSNPGPINPGGTYVLVNPNSNKALDVYSASTADGAKLDIWDQNGTGAQKWTIYDNGDGTYTFVNPNSNKALDVYHSATTDGSPVDIWDRNGTGAQKWKIQGNGDGTYTLVNPNSNKALDVYSASTADGAQIDIWDQNGTVAQKWTFVPTNP